MPILAAPICSEHSILKLRPGGPRPVRTPGALDGPMSNSWSQTVSAQDSALLHDRSRELLTLVASSEGAIVLENPPTPMTFMDPEMQAWIRAVAPFAIQIAACLGVRLQQTRAPSASQGV